MQSTRQEASNPGAGKLVICYQQSMSKSLNGIQEEIFHEEKIGA
jgi:hypothetical protein